MKFLCQIYEYQKKCFLLINNSFYICRMILDFRLLVFKTVAQKGSFTKAADELSISQPAVSKHINELETQLGGPLFIREIGKITLTEKGEKLLEYSKRILYLYRCINEELTQNGERFSGTLSIGASSTISQYVLPEIVARFKNEHPEIKITIKSGNSEQIEKMLTYGEIDFGIIEGRSNKAGLHYEHFADDEIVLVCADRNENKELTELTLEKLSCLPLVIREYGSGTLDVIEHAIELHGKSLKNMNIEIQFGSTESIKRYLSNSESFAMISISAIRSELKERKLKVIEIKDLEIFREFRFISKQGDHSKLSELFKQFCLKNYTIK